MVIRGKWRDEVSLSLFLLLLLGIGFAAGLLAGWAAFGVC